MHLVSPLALSAHLMGHSLTNTDGLLFYLEHHVLDTVKIGEDGWLEQFHRFDQPSGK